MAVHLEVFVHSFTHMYEVLRVTCTYAANANVCDVALAFATGDEDTVSTCAPDTADVSAPGAT